MSNSNQKCVLASGNKGKLAELSDALASHRINLLPQSEFNVSEADETAVTFVENALIKARHASAATGLPALADDSGLVVPALLGEPGIRSARYAQKKHSTEKPTDTENIEKLLQALTPDKSRDAYFACVLVYLRHTDDPEPIIATGQWHGTILTELTGDGGFGYDPVFYCPVAKVSAAAMGRERKREVSHRAIALKKLHEQLSTG